MLHSITLDGFRSFAATTNIELAKLTVLAGANNVGKSSVLAALAALVQSRERASGPELLLRGDWVDLGRFDQVVSYRRTGAARSFDLGLRGDSDEGVIDAIWHFEAATGDHPEVAACTALEYCVGGHVERAVPAPSWPARREQLSDDGAIWSEVGGLSMASLLQVSRIDGSAVQPLDLSHCSPATFRHIGPYRGEPRELYGGRMQAKGPPVGHGGAFTAEFLYRHRHLQTDLLPAPGKPQLLGHAVNAWWSHVFGVPLSAEVNELERIGFTLRVSTPSAENLGLGMVGLGLSQALPILVLGLAAAPDEILAVETPEAHLHPAAQHRLAGLFVKAAAAGTQVIVETHSEHVLNAVRIAVRRGELPAEDVAIHFFEMDDDGATTHTRVELDERGRALHWPAGFFDQAAVELTELL